MNLCHTCDTPACVNPDHLLVGTQKDNIYDMMSKGRNIKGENHPNCRLSYVHADIIREVWDKFGRGSQSKIAKYYGVCGQSVSKIINNQNWKSQ